MTRQLNILLVSSDPNLTGVMTSCLAQLSLTFDTLDSVEAFEDEYTSNLDLCLIDTARARESALEFAMRLRAVHPFVGLVCINANNDVASRIQSWQSGADQVICQPLEPQELVPMIKQLAHRIQTLLGNFNNLNKDSHRLELSSSKRTISGPTDEVSLTGTEYLLLQSLARAKNKSLELWQIYDLLGKTEETLQKPAIEAQLYRLRKKLRDCGAGNQALKSVRLRGYQLCVPIWIS